MPDAILIRGLTKAFGPKVAVKDLDLSVPQGSLCGFIGPNGAGKTTTIRMIMSIIFADSGELTVLGKASAIESKDRIGYLPEERGVYRKMRVLPFLVYMARLKGIDGGAARQKSLEWLERMGLGEASKKKCEELSKGMQQKVQFISAVIHEPDLLILDEVFSGLDPVNRRLMRELIEEQHKKGRTIVFSTHAMYEAEQLCDRVFMIHHGVKVLDDTLVGIRARFDPKTIVVEPLGNHAAGASGNGESVESRLRGLPGVSHVERDKDSFSVGVAEGAEPSRIMADVAGLMPVRRVELKRVNLEDVFIDLVQASGDQKIDRADLRNPAAEREVARVKTFLVARREFLAAVLTKGFLLGILLPPIIMTAALTLMPLLMNSAAPKTSGTIAVIDQSGLVADALKTALDADAFKSRRAKRMEKASEQVQSKMKEKGIDLPVDKRSADIAKTAIEAGAATLCVEILAQGTNVDEAKKPLMDANVRENESTNAKQRVALVVIPDSTIHPQMPAAAPLDTAARIYEHYQIFTAPKLDMEVTQDISDQVDKAIVDARLREEKLDPARIRALTANPVTDTKVVTREGERSDNGVAAMMIPGAFLVLLWVSVFVGGQGLLMSTVEEKSSRVMEVLLSAVSPMQLMVGKILGQMGVASLILGLYSFTGVGALVFFSMSHLLDPMTLVYAAIYFVIAFFLMASMMAAIGSVVNDIREAQALMQPIMIVMVIPMMLWMPIGGNPNGMFAQIVSFIPPISPFVMVIRLAGSEKIPVWQIPASMAVGVLAMVFMAWATAKIFRIGVLMYGKPPNLKTLVRWVRMA